jgi:hypothetical protein
MAFVVVVLSIKNRQKNNITNPNQIVLFDQDVKQILYWN